MTHFISISVPLIRSVPHPLPHFNLREWSFFMGGGGLEMGGGDKQSFTLINRGGQKSFSTEKGGVIKVFELKYDV